MSGREAASRRLSVALYDPYLDARGGGEKYLLQFGDVLARDEGADVTLLVHRNHDRGTLLDDLRGYFGLALTGFRTRTLGTATSSPLTYVGYALETRNSKSTTYFFSSL